jgi:hypothetical protein
MKRSAVLFLIFVLMSPLAMRAQNRGGRTEREKVDTTDEKPVAIGRQVQQPLRQTDRPIAVGRPAQKPLLQPVVINMNRSSSGSRNRNYPAQQPSQKQENRQPSYGQLQMPKANQAPAASLEQPNRPAIQQPSAQTYSSQGTRAANVVHHHAFTPGYVRKKLQKIGVTTAPSYITDRSEIIHTDRAHSTIHFPPNGPNREALSASSVSPRHFNDGIVRDQMARVGNDAWREKVQGLNRSETRVNNYYWHQDDGFNYCHYLDGNGYHWYGWYVGNQFFWNRYFNSRWWWYDSDFDRWCFWNNGFWWWQDPYHMGDLYCYNNDAYIPCNSAQDQVVVTASDNPSNEATYVSSDDTRVVKLYGDTQDAYLYDRANPPAFEPVYLASGVKSVQFSNTGNGRPLEIILSLNDGSFDMFDGQGNPYNP